MSDPRVLRAIVQRARHGALATLSREPPGFPFATLVAVAFDPRGQPLLLLSRLAEHTKNLEVCRRASLLVADASGPDDPLAAGRMTLVGECGRLADAEQPEGRERYLQAHPEAAGYARFAEFAAWRLEVASVRWVGGFGRMDWLDAGAYAGLCSGEG
jgi:heme iron utilization protein